MVDPVRQAGSEALASALQLFPTEVDVVIKKLVKLYNDKLVMTPPVVDQFGRQLEPAVDLWQPRAGSFSVLDF